MPKPKFPWKISFQPTADVQFPDISKDLDWKQNLMKITSGTVIFQVHAWDAPDELGGVEYMIGTIVSQSDVT